MNRNLRLGAMPLALAATLTIALAAMTAATATAADPSADKVVPSADPATADAFLKLCGTKAESAQQIGVAGADGWLFFKAELRHLGVGPFWGESAEKTSLAANADARDPLAAIVDFKSQLDKLGIELIVLPVPTKAIIYPDKLSDGIKAEAGKPLARLDVNHQQFYKLLADKGIKVLDLTGPFLARREEPGDPLYCKSDTHWSGRGCQVAAAEVAGQLKGRPWFAEVAKVELGSSELKIQILGDLLADKKAATPEPLTVRRVGVKSGDGLSPTATPADCPVLVLSDSHGLVFHIGEDLFARDAGFVDQLALELGFPVDLLGSRGDGVTKVRADLYRKGRADPAWLKSKKVIIWCFSAREFTQCTNGWRKLPVTR